MVLASATSWAMLRLLLGNNPLFQVPQYQFGASRGIRDLRSAGSCRRLRLSGVRKTPSLDAGALSAFSEEDRVVPAVAGGLTIGLMGWFVPQILGVGYKHVGEVLNGRFALKLMISCWAELFAVAISYASGNAGGIFGPSLFMGAMLAELLARGAALSARIRWFARAYALVGMGTAFAGIIRAPMTSVVMNFWKLRETCRHRAR